MARRLRLTGKPPRSDSDSPADGAAPTVAEQRRILLPVAGRTISRRSIDAAVRAAQTDNATIVAALLVRVPRHLPIDSPLPALGIQGMPALEAIEQRAAAQAIAVDPRLVRGRTYRDALNHLLDQEQFDRIVVPATGIPGTGLSIEDLKWLLQRGTAEITVLRPLPTR
jgi:hypothetical protein